MMRLSDLQTRWQRREVSGWTVVSDTKGHLMENSAPVGDFLREYIGHLTMPWYRRWSRQWKTVEQKMRQILNDNNVVTWLDRG